MKTQPFSRSLEAIKHICIISMIAGTIFMYYKPAYASPSEWLDRCEPYEKQVKEILKNEGVSEDFYYLMVAESRCTINAKSIKGARGFWQLMPSTAKHYGCKDLDNLECSTRAAAKYLKSLESRFHNFDSVIAAYNMGGHNLKACGMSKDAKNLVYTVRKLIQDSMQSQSKD